MIAWLSPLSCFFIMPMFALANTAVKLGGGAAAGSIAPAAGIGAGLLLGTLRTFHALHALRALRALHALRALCALSASRASSALHTLPRLLLSAPAATQSHQFHLRLTAPPPPLPKPLRA